MPSVHQAVHSLRSLLLRRSGYCEQAWEELSSVHPAGSKAIGLHARMRPIERGWCELELGRLDDAGRSFDDANHDGNPPDDPEIVAAYREGQAAVTLARGAPGDASAFPARADAVRNEAPARLSLHARDVERVRREIERQEAEARASLNSF